MRKHLSSIILLAILLLPAALAVISTIGVVEAAGNVTINDFTCLNTRGTVPFTTRLNGNVSGVVTSWRFDFYSPQINHWSFAGDNGSDVTTGHTFGAAGGYGVFNVTLDVWGPGGNDSLKKIDYVVGNKNTTGLPTAAFSASTHSGDAPLKVTFTDNSKNSTTSKWYFGLKDASYIKNETYTFDSPGTYRVVLEVSNSRGWDATAQEITVTGQQQGKILPTANFDADTSTGLTVRFVDSSQNENSSMWNFGDGTNSTDFSPTHTYPNAGNYTVHLTVSNANGTATAEKTISVQESSSSSGSDNGGDNSGGGDSIGSATVENSGGSSSGGSSSGGSGSGGAGLSPENQSNVEAKELSQTFIGNGNSVTFDFPQSTTPVTNISFDSKKTAGKTTAIVEVLLNQSSLVSEPPSDEIYKFVNIWVGSSGFATPENIENAVVNFKVEKSWLQDKNIDKSSITLNIYNDTNTWNALPTNLSSEDDKYLYFTAKTPAFSAPFAITGKIANAAVNVTPSETQTEPNIGSLENNTSNAANEKQTPEQTQSPSTKTPGFETVYGIIGLLGVFLYIRRK